jgi:hypothetical protein
VKHTASVICREASSSYSLQTVFVFYGRYVASKTAA